MKSKKITSNIAVNETVFDKLSSEWWDENGSFSALHSFNPIRMKFILDAIGSSLKNLKVLDVGCGGGILCEPMSRLGALVTGIDENKKAITVAKEHAKKMNLKINYLHGKAADLNINEKFDVVTCMEVVEHVEDVNSLILQVKNLLKDDGFFIGSTINQTITSYISAILLAEEILRIVPKNTHSWKMFVKPNRLKKELIKNNFCEIRFQGVFYNIIRKNWRFIGNTLVNYMFSCRTK